MRDLSLFHTAGPVNVTPLSVISGRFAMVGYPFFAMFLISTYYDIRLA